MRGANYIGNCSGFDQLLIRSFEINVWVGFCAACSGSSRVNPLPQRPHRFHRLCKPCGSNCLMLSVLASSLASQLPQVRCCLEVSAIPVGAGSPAKRPPKKAHQPASALYWCIATKIRILRVHPSPPPHRQMPANAFFYPTLAIFGHWHAICSLVRQVRLADYPRLATPFFQSSGPPRSRPSGGQHVEVGSTHQRS
ncbi:hypothetical protein PssiTeo3_20980 [Pseudomonas sichuanensis]|nr:hypothetical protein [Pseudomonas sichuanensis]